MEDSWRHVRVDKPQDDVINFKQGTPDCVLILWYHCVFLTVKLERESPAFILTQYYGSLAKQPFARSSIASTFYVLKAEGLGSVYYCLLQIK